MAAIRFDPVAPRAGQAFEIHALVVSPKARRAPEVEVSLCGLSTEHPVRVWDMTCFGNPDLVEVIGAQLPLRHLTSDLSEVDGFDHCFEPEGGYLEGDCDSTFPVRVQAWQNTVDGEQEANGYRIMKLHVGSDAPNGVPLADDPRHTLTAEPQGDGSVLLGLTIHSEPTFPGESNPFDVHWLVDGGELLGTARTLARRDPLDDAVLHSTNTWLLPEDASGPLRVWAIFGGNITAGESELFDIHWLQKEVTP